jgi:alanine racemase
MARAQLSISRHALLNNFTLIGKKVPNLSLLPMIKANAYGHGSVYAAESYLSSPAARRRLFGFGVATFQEAIEIRLAIQATSFGQSIPIIVFSDCAPWTAEHLALCRQYKLEPVFSEILSLLEFQRQRGSHELPVHIEVNTGMNRMGIPIDSLPLVKVIPKSIFTHLADADEPRSKLTQLQMKKYEEVVKWARAKYPRTLFHFANSSAIWNAKHFPLMKEMSLARPGLSLYGIRPFQSAKDDGLKRVMTVRAPILNRIYLEHGDQVGYGGTYTCRKKGGEWVAVIGAGYADGVFRSLSSQGVAIYGKKKLNFIGRVSMDLSAVQGVAGMQVGEEVILWGNEIDPYVQAKLAGTIPYELTTRIGERVNRSYE